MLKFIISTATFKQSQITITGTIINGILGALFYIYLARFLGPSDFGILTISLTTLVLIADIADIGTNTGLVRFVSAHLKENREKALRFLKLSLEIKLGAWLIVLPSLFFLAPFISDNIFHKPQLTLFLQLVGFGVGGSLLFTFATSALQAHQKYLSWSIINILTNGLRLIVILFLGTSLVLNSVNGLLIYIMLPFFGFFLSLLILPARDMLTVKGEKSVLKDLIKFTTPVAIFSVIAAISARLDTFLNAALLSTEQVGIYGAANQLVSIMPQLVGALGLVASPKFAAFQNNKDMFAYFKKFQLFTGGLCLIGLLAILPAVYLIPLLFGASYSEAVTPFIILFIAYLIFLFSIPVHNSVIYYFGRPDVFIPVALGHLVIIGGLGYILISNFGITGAALTVLTGMIFNFLYPFAWLLYRLKKERDGDGHFGGKNSLTERGG